MGGEFCILAVLLECIILHNAQGVQQITNPRIIEHPENQYVAKNEPATLNCKAEGDPPPIITWYRDGHPVITADENPQSHRMLLPSGQLFFLRIIHNKNYKPDVGTYYCNATNPETRVSVVSRNATLEIAVLRDDFQKLPRNTQVAVGDVGLLECDPPRGLPEPSVKWEKDSEPVRLGGRFKLEKKGDLVIQDARHTDSGNYVCIAHNKGGERESSPARLLVREKPRITKTPQDVTVQEGHNLQFQCQAEGDPAPTILWKREDGHVPPARSEILTDRSLKISRVQVADEGLYVCRAENSVGFVESTARLTVHSEPTFLVTPRDKVVGVGRRVSFRCEVIGNPPPALFWSKETNQVLMFPRQDVGRFSVTEDGTLVIEGVRLEDAGEYQCQAISVAGSAYAKATLQVKDVDPRPPPIIHQGPQNQTLPTNSVAMLQCSASGDPPPTIRWYKGRHVVTLRDPRYALLDSGTLQISDLHPSDTDIYTCKAMSETGETSWGAALIVESPTDTSIIFHRTPEPSTFPGPPSPPSISHVTDTTMTLKWRANANHGASPVFAYTVEYFSHETGDGWVVASNSITEQTFTVRRLLPDTPYMFLVRAQNSHGLSQPSQVTAPVRTTGQSQQHRPTLPNFDVGLVTEKLSGQVINMLQPTVISSSAIQLNWEILKSQRFIEGYHIKYRVFPALKNHNQREHSHHHHVEFTIETVTTGSATTYMLRNLEKFTWYEIRIQPFYNTIEGQESKSVRIKTGEDRPDKAPMNIKAPLLDNTTLHLTWDAPPVENQNGPLKGFKIFLYGNESKYNREIRVNESVTSIIINHLVHGMVYRIQILSFTAIGDGPPSDPPVIVGGDNEHGISQGYLKEPWFIATLIGTIGCTVWFALCVFSIWLYRKKHANKKMQKNGGGTIGNHKADDGRRAEEARTQVPLLTNQNKALPPLPTDTHSNQNCVSSPCCGEEESQSDLDPQCSRMYTGNHSYQKLDSLQPDVTNVGNDMSKTDSGSEALYNLPNVAPPPMKTFYNKNNSVAQPYATTTLIANNLGAAPGGDSAFRPIQQGYIQQHNASGSSDSCQKPDLSTDSNTDNNRSNPELPPGACMQCHLGGCECGNYTADEDGYDQIHVSPNQPVLFLPPPPEHPPPSDMGTPPDSPTQHHRRIPQCHYSDQGGPHYSDQGGPHYGDQGGPLYSDQGGPHYSDQGGPLYSDGPIYSDQGLVPGYYHVARGPHGIIHTPVSDSGVYSRANMYSDGEQRGQNQMPNRDSCGECPPQQHVPFRGQVPYGFRPPSPKYRTISPHIRGQDLRPYSPHAMSEPERGPTPPVRGYKLVPITDHELDLPKHYSDTEGVPVPPLRLMSQHTPPSPAPEDPMIDRAIQSSLPSLANECLLPDNGVDVESDMEVVARDCPSPRSDMDVDTVTESMIASWASVTDNSDCSSVRTSAASSSDGSFFAEADFASAVAKAAELSGLTVVGSTVIDPNAGKPKNKKSAKYRQRAKRPTSPYSTDSNYSSVQAPHKPYPKSQRKKQLQEHAARGQRPPPIKAKPQGMDVPGYSRPNFPVSANTKTSPDNNSQDVNVRTNPLAAFDTRDTPIV